MTEWDQHKFVFLCGLHRSGTSPIFRLLREHPQISGFRNSGAKEDEGQHLQAVYLPAIAYGGPGKFGFQREARLTEDSILISEENRTALFRQWARHWDLTKPWLLEKSPPNLIRTRFLQAMFPNSYFVAITRHPIPVSLATWKWTKCRLQLLFEHWLECHRIFEEDRQHLQNVLVLKYEDAIRDTAGTLAQVYKFLGLPSFSCTELDAGGNERYFKAWQQLCADRKLAPMTQDIVRKYEKHVRLFGYSFLNT
jgi:hypothetical protein